MFRFPRFHALFALLASLALFVPSDATAGPGPMVECDPNEVLPRSPGWLPGLMADNKLLLKAMRQRNELRFQIAVGEIIETDDGDECLRVTKYRVDAEYTYPASAIKVLGAIGALRAMQQVPGWSVDSPIRIAPLVREFDGEEYQLSPGAGPTAADSGEPLTLAGLIEGALVISSNLAFNSLYDITGRAELNSIARQAGLQSVRLHHRLSQTTAPAAAHRWAPRFEVEIDGNWREVAGVRGPAPELPSHPTDGVLLGRGYVDPATGEVVEEPMNFEDKNGISLLDLMATTVAFARPELFTSPEPFGLETANREVIREAMSKRPTGEDEADTRAREARFKPLSPGVLKAYDGDRDAFTYVNKAGRAYGFHLDSAYIADARSGDGFFVAVTIWPNDNQILNDNEYEYDELSYPAMVALGEVLSRELLRPPAKD